MAIKSSPRVSSLGSGPRMVKQTWLLSIYKDVQSKCERSAQLPGLTREGPRRSEKTALAEALEPGGSRTGPHACRPRGPARSGHLGSSGSPLRCCPAARCHRRGWCSICGNSGS